MDLAPSIFGPARSKLTDIFHTKKGSSRKSLPPCQHDGCSVISVPLYSRRRRPGARKQRGDDSEKLWSQAGARAASAWLMFLFTGSNFCFTTARCCISTPRRRQIGASEIQRDRDRAVRVLCGFPAPAGKPAPVEGVAAFDRGFDIPPESKAASQSGRKGTLTYESNDSHHARRA
jgi:hypothetical protein